MFGQMKTVILTQLSFPQLLYEMLHDQLNFYQNNS